MPAFVTLSIAIVVAILAVTAVVAVYLFRKMRALGGAVQASVKTLQPLAEELSEELAVMQTELEHLQDRASRLRDGRTR